MEKDTNQEALQVATNEDTIKEEVKAPTKKELLLELSKELGVNAFNPEEVKAQFQELKKFQDAQKTEQERLQEQLDSYKQKEEAYNSEKSQYEAQIAALELGIPTENLKDALALARNNMSEGQTIKEGLQAIQEKYSNMFVKSSGTQAKVVVGTQMSDKDDTNNVQMDEALARYLNKKKK